MAGVFNHLNNDAGVTALLSTYSYEGGSRPAIFTETPVPASAEYPYLIVDEIDGVPDDAKEERRKIKTYRISVVCEQTGSGVLVEQIAELVFDLFHLTETLTMTGWSCWMVLCEGPSKAGADEDITQRDVEVQVHMQKTA